MTVRCSLGHENPDGSAFCDECGEPLSSAAPVATAEPQAATGTAGADTQVCANCGATNPAGDTFCASCGAMLGDSAPAAADASSAPVAAPAPDVTAAPVATATALAARLLVEADNQEFDISGKDNVTIGREDAVSNIFPDIDLTEHGGEEGGVSRMHARIFVESGQYMLEDENSTNFTFLNRQKLAPKTPTALHDNDEIRLGRVLLKFKEA